MKEVHTGRSTRMALHSATSTWRTAVKDDRAPVQISPGHLEKEQQLDNALDEYCLLRKQDSSLTASRFCERYPSYRHSLRRLIDVHDAMDGQPALDEENWPELFTDFLGYEILHELGIGAIARVYLASEAALGGRLVAIKVAREGGYEAETLGKLTHPNIVPVFSVKHDEQSDLTAVCMPYHGSATLADLLEVGFQNGKPPTSARVILDAAREREQIVDFVESIGVESRSNTALARGSYVDGVVRLGIQMAEALAYTHERGILHRDLKPSNVLLTPGGVPMLLDFNLASDIESGSRRLGGTLPYMPPEQIRDVHLQPFAADIEVDPRSDVFSLGVILYELLTGELPFGDPPAGIAPRQAAEVFLAAQQQVLRSVRELNPAVSSELAQVLHACLAFEPSERPTSATDLTCELKKYFAPKRRLQRWTSSHRGTVAMLLLMSLSTAFVSTLHLATRPTYAVREFDAGFADIERHRYRDAVQHLNHAIDAEENSIPFRFVRGVAYQRLGDHKQAEIDLSDAAKQLDDPVILECCAYSLLKTSGAASSSGLSARVLYSRMSTLTQLSAEADLNWAFASFDGRAVPALVIARCTSALGKRPDWQEAYYLRGLGHYLEAKHRLEVPQAGRDENMLAQSIRNARTDFERAIAIGPPSWHLYTDAAESYMLPSADLTEDRLHELLLLAARHGIPASLLESFGRRYGWAAEPWFQHVVSSCSPNLARDPEPNYRERFLTAPNPFVVDAKLKSIQLQ